MQTSAHKLTLWLALVQVLGAEKSVVVFTTYGGWLNVHHYLDQVRTRIPPADGSNQEFRVSTLHSYVSGSERVRPFGSVQMGVSVWTLDSLSWAGGLPGELCGNIRGLGGIGTARGNRFSGVATIHLFKDRSLSS
ncbi:hypothetical protein EDC04DRAFT_2641839 [Pisolithus marmoratus]|nr:hypothetical protein EDC04DRAFT_2641839 [Pisolithus marmoratus]